MGAASSTKWAWRIAHPMIRTLAGELRRRVVDTAKLACRKALAQARQEPPLFAERRASRVEALAKAERTKAAHRVRRRKAAARRGWTPYAQR